MSIRLAETTKTLAWQFIITRVVVDKKGDAVPGVQPQGPKQVGALVGAFVQLAIGDRLTRAGHDIGGLVRGDAGVLVGMHGTKDFLFVSGSAA
jgi:hypothetical protein